MRAIGFFRRVYADNDRRRDRRRRLAGDVLRWARNALLSPRNAALVRAHYSERWPIVLVVGAPRSGTTLLSQLMARHLEIAWIDNRAARYWSVPVEGLRRSLACGAADPGAIELRSSLGSSEGERGPHEFGWFWQWFGAFPDADELSAEESLRVDWAALRRQLYAMSGLAQRALLLKSITFVNYQIEALAGALPNVRFVHIRRDARQVVRSILEARRQRYADERCWWSLRPRAYRDWQTLDPVAQVCRQVVHATRAIDAALLGPVRGLGLSLDYERLIAEPQASLASIARHVGVPLRAELELGRLVLASGNRSDEDGERSGAIARELEKLA